MPHQYNSIAAFRRALEDRLNQQAREQRAEVMRLRRLVAFDRLLARLFFSDDSPWILKGGYANELRLQGRARATRDIDLSIPQQAVSAVQTSLGDLLQKTADRDLGDWFRFRIGEPMRDLDGPPEGGTRFPVTALLDRPFTDFHIDVGLGDIFTPPAERLTGHDLLAFAGIAPPRIKVLRKEQQFAEKVHAYTLPRAHGNSRIKDLVDLVLFVEMQNLKPRVVVRCLRETFNHRGTHNLPRELTPPEGWRDGYLALAAECGLQAATLDQALDTVSAYWDDLPLFPLSARARRDQEATAATQTRRAPHPGGAP